VTHRLKALSFGLSFLVAAVLPVTGQLAESSVEVVPSAIIPVGQSAGVYNIGVDVALNGSIPLGELPIHVDAGLGYGGIPTTGDLWVSLVTGGIGAGLRFAPAPFLTVGAGLRLGGYVSLAGGEAGGNPLISASLRTEWNLTAGLSIGLGGEYRYLFNREGETILPFLSSVQAGISARIVPANFSSGGPTPQLQIEIPEFDRVFPVFYRYYDSHPLGAVTIRNEEKQAIQDVTVSFFVAQYMSAPEVCVEIPEIERDESLSVPLFALFSEDIVDITESTTSQAEIIVEYTLGKNELVTQRVDSLRIQNRNQMTWDDDNKAAAFVTAGDPSVQRVSRNTVAATRDTTLSLLDPRIKTAMAVFETLRLYGLAYVVDPDSSYIELSQDETALDYLQFPVQTLDYQAGDCDDLSILYTALLESIGTPTAFVTIPGHIYTAFRLQMTAAEARRTLSSSDDLIFIDDAAWLPVETTLVNEGFMKAWQEGARQWRDNDARGVATLYPVRDAWVDYEPTGFSGEAIDLALPGPEAIREAFMLSLDGFVDKQLWPQVRDLMARIEESNNNPRLVNRLGALYARYGQYDEARQQFESILRSRPYAPAAMNLGNIAYIEKDYDQALSYYERALDLDPGSGEILVSIARTHFELGDFEAAEARYLEAEMMNAELAGQFAYIVDGAEESGRASDTQGTGAVLWSD
jgi:tetratricopeptide (TPR) repeat protein